MSIFKRPKSRMGKSHESMSALNTTTSVSSSMSRSPLSPRNGSPNSGNSTGYNMTEKLDPEHPKLESNSLVFRYEESEGKITNSSLYENHFGIGGRGQLNGHSNSVKYGDRHSLHLERRKLSKVRSLSPIIQHNRPATALEKPQTIYDVAIIGAGPAGLVLAANLVRFGVSVLVLDNRSGKTLTGRADSLQPKTMETFRQMRLADKLLQKGVKVHDTRFWSSESPLSINDLPMRLKRQKRDVLFPPDLVDTIDPYLLNSHQGFLEGILLEDLLERDLEVHRNITFVDYNLPEEASNLRNPIEIMCESDVTREKLKYQAKYLIGADGAMSNVRRLIPGARPTGNSSGEIWGVIDGTLDTDFPDIYSKTVVHNREAGTIVIFPRERNMTRVYVELKSDYLEESAIMSQNSVELTQVYVMDQIAEIMEPYTIRWKNIEWFGRYQISRKLASRFTDSDRHPRVFLIGDAAHTHSPKSQGMNSGIHDASNLAWKLNLCVRNLCKSTLLSSYENERRQVAEDLLDYDTEQLDALTSGDSDAFAENIIRNARIVSGFGADYTPSFLNVSQKGSILGQLRVGSIPPPGKVTRFFDMNPVDIQLDIPMLGQFRIYLFTRTISSSSDFLDQISQFVLDQTTSLGKALTSANHSYSLQPPVSATSDEFIRPERYTTISGLVTFALVLRSMEFDDIDLRELPPLFKESQYTIYMDDVPHLDTKGMTCSEKWLGSVAGSEVDVVVVRPDGYVGTMYRGLGSKEHAKRACKHLSGYFEGFLSV